MVAALSDVVSKLGSQLIGTGVSKGPFVEKTLSFGEF